MLWLKQNPIELDNNNIIYGKPTNPGSRDTVAYNQESEDLSSHDQTLDSHTHYNHNEVSPINLVTKNMFAQLVAVVIPTIIRTLWRVKWW